MSLAALGIGANLPSTAGEPAATLAAAFEELGSYGTVIARSHLYRTAPVGFAEQPDFLNAALVLETALPPRSLLEALLAIERSFGRDRSRQTPKGPRTLDLDLLLYDDLVLDQPELTVPHPAMHQRRFVLEPLAELVPDWQHPLLHLCVGQLLAALPQDSGAVTKIAQ